MYTSYIGKKFLKLYNEKTNQKFSARQFFDDVFFPLFFDNEKHLMHVSNSPFFQKPSAKAMEGGLTKSQAQLKKLHSDILVEEPNMAIFVGYAAKDMEGTTSGQLTNIDFKIDPEEMYASWIGEALGMGVSGGFVILLGMDEVLWALFEGWKIYRKYLQQTPNLKDRQIETWNGKWITHFFSDKYNPAEPNEQFELGTDQVLGKLAITTQKWSEVIFALSKKFPTQEPLIYGYNLSRTNTTLGFIKIYLPDVEKMFEFRDKIFLNKKDAVLTDDEISRLQTYYNFKGACKLGTIGLKALEPGKLRDFMPPPFGKGDDYKFSDENSYKQYELYKIWIIAMLNKIELNELAAKVAQALWDFERNAKEIELDDADEITSLADVAQKMKAKDRGKTGKAKLTDNVRSALSLVKFIDALNAVMEKGNVETDVFLLAKEEALKMPMDLFPLFISLIKFEYTYIKSKK